MSYDDRTSGHNVVVRHQAGMSGEDVAVVTADCATGPFTTPGKLRDAACNVVSLAQLSRTTSLVKSRLRKSHPLHKLLYQSASAQADCWTVMGLGILPMSLGLNPHVVSACPNSRTDQTSFGKGKRPCRTAGTGG